MNVCFLLTFLCLLVLFVILLLIFVNAVRRSFFAYTSGLSHHPMHDIIAPSGGGGINGGNGGGIITLVPKCVDLYATSLDSLQPLNEKVLPGMTALIDRGMMHLETGVYILQQDNDNHRMWNKIAVPEVGDCFKILRGEFAGKQHTIRPSFLNEIRAPSEWQIVDNDHLYQDLDECTQTVHVTNDVRAAPHMTVNNTLIKHGVVVATSGRMVQLINTSATFTFTLVVNNEQVCVNPKSVRHVFLNVANNNTYFIGAIS